MRAYCLIGIQDTGTRYPEIGAHVRKVMSKKVFLSYDRALKDIERFKKKITNPDGWYKYDPNKVHIAVIDFELDLVKEGIKKMSKPKKHGAKTSKVTSKAKRINIMLKIIKVIQRESDWILLIFIFLIWAFIIWWPHIKRGNLW